MALDGSLREVCARAEALTPHAWQFPCPGEAGEPDAQEAEAALSTARGLYDAILDRMPPEAHP